MRSFWTNAPIPPRSGPPLTTRIAQDMAEYSLRQMPTDYPRIYRERHEQEYSALPEAREFTPTELVFEPGQPNCFWPEEGGVPYRGQDLTKRWLDLKVRAMDTEGRIKVLAGGNPGLGKTALMWILAERIIRERVRRGVPRGEQRFFELLPNQFEGKAEFDAFMLQLRPWDILFIDEVHVLKEAIGEEPLYHMLADTGRPRYPLGEGAGWLAVPPTVCWLTATTDPGMLSDALRRRLEPEVHLEDPTVETLAEILHDQGMPIHPDAAFDLASRSSGMPWHAILAYQQARDVAVVSGSPLIDPSHVRIACEIMGLDEQGLTREDRAVLRVLLQAPHRMASGELRYRLPEGALCTASGVDPRTYATRVKPKLIKRGLLSTTGGQTLTERAVQEYAHLREG